MFDEYEFGSVKFKGGVFDPEIEVETIRQLRQEFGPQRTVAHRPQQRLDRRDIDQR